jgi:hypothetical protein
MQMTYLDATAEPDNRWKRDYLVFGLLMLVLVAVHFLVAGELKSGSQAAVFSWPGLAAIAAIGAVGVALTRFARMHGPWEPSLSIGEKIWKPLGVGLVIGALALGADLLTHQTEKMAQAMHLNSIHIDFPVSIPIYYGASILVSVIYFFVLIPLVVWLVGRLLLKGKHETAVFWVIGTICALIEPITQGELPHAMTDAGAALYMIPGLGLVFGQVYFLRRAGLIACVLVRVGYYTFSHIAAGLLAGAY